MSPPESYIDPEKFTKKQPYFEPKTGPGPLDVDTEDVPKPTAARNMVYAFIKDRLEKTDTHVTFSEDEVYVVWFAYVLGNWKALVSTSLPDGMYYEVTFNQAKKEVYIDAYKKFSNQKFEYRDVPA